MSNSRRIRWRLMTLGLVWLVVCGCANKAMMESTDHMGRAAAKPSAPFAKDLRTDTALAEALEPDSMAVAKGEAPTERMVHYDGFIHLRGPRPVEIVEEATRIVEAVGGHVERLDGETAVFRVPVAEFQPVFDRLLGLGDVVERSVTAEDVTDAFMDVDLRLEIARATHRRLVELLARAKEEKEKMRILQEIQRIRIDIETLGAQREHLLSMARFSSITLRIEARRSDRGAGRRENIAAFRWIRDLSPFAEQVARSGKPLPFPVPEDMVALEKKGMWAAESADGAVMRCSRHDRQPDGDTEFWLEAVRLRLAPDYADAKVLEKGDFKVLRLEDRSETPYIYLVGLFVNRSRDLELVEVYFPTPAHESRYQEQIFTAIAGGGR